MVDAEKIRRVRRAAEAWLSVHPNCRGLVVRFDVIVERAGRLEQLANAF
jgi:Holliday junction resolvase-like predicted endonuclease